MQQLGVRTSANTPRAHDKASKNSPNPPIPYPHFCDACFKTTLQLSKISFPSIRFEADPLLKEPGMWCFAFAYFFCLLGSITMYVIFKDFATYKGLGDVSSMALSAAGIGDLIGRFGGGMLATSKVSNLLITSLQVLYVVLIWLNK